jgi:hypothetical protein
VGQILRPTDYGYDKLGELLADYPQDFEMQRDGNLLKIKSLRNDDQREYDIYRVHDTIEQNADEDGWAALSVVAEKSNVEFQPYGATKFSTFIKMFPNEFEHKVNGTTMFIKRK